MVLHYRDQSQQAPAVEALDDVKPVVPNEEALEDAAQTLRAIEVEAAQPDVASLDEPRLREMSIDELRAVADALDVPDRATIIDRDELLAAILRRL